MALFVPGMKCPLCGLPILPIQPYRLLPLLAQRTKDPLHVFHDATVHTECLLADPRWPSLERALRLRDEALSKPKACVVCREAIIGSLDFYPTNLLTSDESDPLYRFNFLLFHRSHLQQWEHWPELSMLLSRRDDAGEPRDE